ncbi:TPR-like protein [Cylindrobasidium torrendii FP15055 ss-10]|uniref:TPR-like protein n=1 Tax=Cylindrobasidium torrendii FP15055 ss-10 TaxID=1314674 RepID=A0A0D7AZD1_9AGAR|nr:TPR-like protein [Cylindrobasidium torrendii FP15055 ss-10]
MTMRHMNSRSAVDRDTRMHDPSPMPSAHAHSHSLHSTPHMNGNGLQPAIPPSRPTALVSPTTSNGRPPRLAQQPRQPEGEKDTAIKLKEANESTWLLIGRIAEQMGDLEHALSAYENALRHNPNSLSGLTQVAGIARIKENYPKAVEYFQRVLDSPNQEDNGEVWSALGHCFLMQDDLQKAYSAYQQALYLLPNPKEDPKLWYGIGILYDRYGSLDHAEEAFSSVLRMDSDFDKANEILFRLGIIYKQQTKYDESLKCFDRILRNPPSPLAHHDIWFQVGHVYEQQKDYVRAKDAYERVVQDSPNHAKVLQQLGWLYHQDGSSFQNQELAIQYLTKSLEADATDAQSWYLLGRAYMAGQKYNKAYEAYQQAVYRDGRNPTFWCSIGVLYFQINQFRDALDAYSRAIRINPYISEVWFDLGSLYESCNNQISDALDAYHRASELDPSNTVITQRLQLLKQAQATGGQLPAAPGPQDVHPTAYANTVMPPVGLAGGPLLIQPGGSGSRPPNFRPDSRGPIEGAINLPPPSQVHLQRGSPPFRGGPPPPVIIDDARHLPSHPGIGPIELERPRDSAPRHGSLLLHHPAPERNGHHPEGYFGRGGGPTTRPHSTARSISPARSPVPPFPPFPASASGRRTPSTGPGQPPSVQRSPRGYGHDQPPQRAVESDGPWERRPNPEHARQWDNERNSRARGGDYSGGYPPPFPTRSPAPGAPIGHSPRMSSSSSASRYRGERSGRLSPLSRFVESQRSLSPATSRHGGEYHREYAPYPAREERHPPPSAGRASLPPPPQAEYLYEERRLNEQPVDSNSSRGSGSPILSDKERRTRKGAGERKKRTPPTPAPAESSSSRPSLPPTYRTVQHKPGSPQHSNGSVKSGNTSPNINTNANNGLPKRFVDEDYDEGVADSLSLLANAATTGPRSSYRSLAETSAPDTDMDTSNRPSPVHRDSVSSTRSHNLTPPQSSTTTSTSTTKKRAASPSDEIGPDSAKRTRSSSRPSPIPFMHQPSSSRRSSTSRSPRSPQLRASPPPPPPIGPMALPPHPGRPQAQGSATLPPIATLGSSPEPMAVDDSKKGSPTPSASGSKDEGA